MAKAFLFEVEVLGPMVKRFDTKTGVTTLRLDDVQAAKLMDELTPIVAFNQTYEATDCFPAPDQAPEAGLLKH